VTDEQLVRRAAVAGGVATAPGVVAVVGWASHWNAYTNLSLTLGSFVLWYTLVAATRKRETP